MRRCWDGELEPLTTRATRPVALAVPHAGVRRVAQYRFSMG